MTDPNQDDNPVNEGTERTSDDAQSILDALTEISTVQSKVIKLLYVDGVTYGEAARMLSIPANRIFSEEAAATRNLFLICCGLTLSEFFSVLAPEEVDEHSESKVDEHSESEANGKKDLKKSGQKTGAPK